MAADYETEKIELSQTGIIVLTGNLGEIIKQQIHELDEYIKATEDADLDTERMEAVAAVINALRDDHSRLMGSKLLAKCKEELEGAKQ